MITVNNRDKIKWKKDITVADILKIMGYDYSLISVHVNDEFVSEDDYSEQTVPDNAKVAIIHLAHGG